MANKTTNFGRLDDSGYISVFTAITTLALASAVGIVVLISTAVIHGHQAQVAADLVATTAAYEYFFGDNACLLAREVAEINHAELQDCVVDTDTGDVQVAVAVGKRVQKARAGPL
ncbi:Rv3654c family TadE-like protein [Corynebacterium caspium]|nr:Rv3654c family TadE-like protein [Corynebacterium caspium]